MSLSLTLLSIWFGGAIYASVALGRAFAAGLESSAWFFVRVVFLWPFDLVIRFARLAKQKSVLGAEPCEECGAELAVGERPVLIVTHPDTGRCSKDRQIGWMDPSKAK